MVGEKSNELTDTQRQLIEEELDVHERVRQAVRQVALKKQPNMANLVQDAKELRDEAIKASERDLPALFQAMYTQQSLAKRDYTEKTPELIAPYFGHMVLEENGKTRDVLVGHLTFINSDYRITIIDWRHAALAQIFFNYRQGDEYEIELPGRLATGILKSRRVITFARGVLVGVKSPDFNLTRVDEQNPWLSLTADDIPKLVGGQGQAITTAGMVESEKSHGTLRLPDVSALLDKDQYALLASESKEMFVLGAAGCGKTTVALHRLAQLYYDHSDMFAERPPQIIVPEAGIAGLTRRLLRELKVENCLVDTFDIWVERQGRKILRLGSKEVCQVIDPSVYFLKRHPVMLVGIAKVAAAMKKRITSDMRALVPRDPERPQDEALLDQLVDKFEQARGNLFDNLMRCRSSVRQDLQAENLAWTRNSFEKLISDQLDQIFDFSWWRSELFTSSELFDYYRQQPGIDDAMLKRLEAHTRKQLSDKSDGNDASIRELDGEKMQNDEYAGTLDPEDFAIGMLILSELMGRVNYKGKSLTVPGHLLIDEAQDLTKTEFSLLSNLRHKKAFLTVAGDAAQQSDDTVQFSNWGEVAEVLKVNKFRVNHLQTNYRCSEQVGKFGRHVLGNLAAKQEPVYKSKGLPVVISKFPSSGVAILSIAEALEGLFQREPAADVAIVTSSDEIAEEIFNGLVSIDRKRLVLDGDFSFKPGVDVTTVPNVKGLEFGYVIIPDANLREYPDTPIAKKSLHIAITRTVHQLWVVSGQHPTPLIDGWVSS